MEAGKSQGERIPYRHMNQIFYRDEAIMEFSQGLRRELRALLSEALGLGLFQYLEARIMMKVDSIQL